MKIFSITVKTACQRITYTAIGTSSAEVIMAAIARFGICGVSVRPAGA